MLCVAAAPIRITREFIAPNISCAGCSVTAPIALRAVVSTLGAFVDVGTRIA